MASWMVCLGYGTEIATLNRGGHFRSTDMITSRKIPSAMRSIRKAERPDGWSHPVTIGSVGLFQSTTHSQFQRQSPTPRSSVNAGFSCKIL